jgi:hypothetical protein
MPAHTSFTRGNESPVYSSLPSPRGVPGRPRGFVAMQERVGEPVWRSGNPVLTCVVASCNFLPGAISCVVQLLPVRP